jgi:hypothetical protein
VAICAARRLYLSPPARTKKSQGDTHRRQRSAATQNVARGSNGNREEGGVKVFADRTFSSVRELTPFFIHLFAYQVARAKQVTLPLWMRNGVAETVAMILPWAWRMAPKDEVINLPAGKHRCFHIKRHQPLPLLHISIVSGLP